MVSRWAGLQNFTSRLRHKKLIFSLANLSFYRQPSLLVRDVMDEFKKNRRHWVVIQTIQELISNFVIPSINTFRFVIHGKINNADRARTYIYHEVSMDSPIVQSGKQVLEAASFAKAKTGVFGFKF